MAIQYLGFRIKRLRGGEDHSSIDLDERSRSSLPVVKIKISDNDLANLRSKINITALILIFSYGATGQDVAQEWRETKQKLSRTRPPHKLLLSLPQFPV